MNHQNLGQLIFNYIEKFEEFSYGDHDETYKWEDVQYFQDNLDLDVSDESLHDMLYDLWRNTHNLIDSANQQPFYALVDYAEKEPAVVRKMFKDLYTDDLGDLSVRQQKIQEFIDQSEVLKNRYYPDSWRYTNDQRSVMAYLFFYDPDHNYMYKSTQAHEFADCVEFLDDFGSGASFSLETYYKMCDELVEAMRETPELLSVNQGRFQKDPNRKLYPDDALHILCFDVIFSSQTYKLYDGIFYTHPTAAEKRSRLDKKAKAIVLKEAYDQALADMEKLNQVREHFESHLKAGAAVRHRAYGLGTVESLVGDMLTVQFSEKYGTKKLSCMTTFSGGFITTEDPEAAAYIHENLPLLKGSSILQRKLDQAKAELAVYADEL